jgi:hypothetical protein
VREERKEQKEKEEIKQVEEGQHDGRQKAEW